MNRTAAVFGTIWGIFALLFSLFLFLNLLAPAAAEGTSYEVFSGCVRAYYDGAEFGIEAWAIAAGAFGLGALGLIGAGLVRQHHITAGLFLLISNIGVLVICFQSFLVGSDGILNHFAAFLYAGAPETVLIALITLLITLLGFFGSLFSLAFKPKLSSSRPAQPVAPVQPAAPAQPAVPVQPAASVQSAAPVQPAAPAHPAPEPVAQPLAEPEAAQPLQAQGLEPAIETKEPVE